MFHPQFGFNPGHWQGLQSGQVCPQLANLPNPVMRPNLGPIPLLNDVRWSNPSMNPVIQQQFPGHFVPNIPQQPQSTGNNPGPHFQMSNGPFHSPQAGQTILNQQPIPGQVNIPTALNYQSPSYVTPGIPSAPMLSPVNSSMNNHVSRQQPIPGQAFHCQQSFPGQSFLKNQPLSGQSLASSQTLPCQSFPGNQYLPGPSLPSIQPHPCQSFPGGKPLPQTSLPSNQLLPIQSVPSTQLFTVQSLPSNQPLPGQPPFPGATHNFSGNDSSGQLPPAPPLPPNPPPTLHTPLPPGQPPVMPPLPPDTPSPKPPKWEESNQKPKDLSKTEKNHHKSRSRNSKSSSRDVKTHRSSSKSEHSSRKEPDSPRKRKNYLSPSRSRHGDKRSRHDSKSSDRKTQNNSRSRDKSDGNPRHSPRDGIRRTSYSDRNANNRSSTNRLQHEDKKATNSSRSCETTGRDQPFRCISPPAPDIKRKVKFIVPEDLYLLTRQGMPPRTMVTATKELQIVYQTFENKVLKTPNEVETTQIQDLPGLAKSLCTKDATDRNSEDNFNSDSDVLDPNDFENAYRRIRGGSSSDEFEDSDDSEDSDENESDGNSSDSSSDWESSGKYARKTVQEYRQRKLSDPRRLHKELWFNEPGEGNDGPVCKCCANDKHHGIRHAVYPGEKDIPLCDPLSNNSNKLHHYWVTVTPHCNFMTDRPTVITHRDKDYFFEGFSLISHEPIDWIPTCSFIRFNIEYTIHLIKEPLPKNFCIKGLDLFSKFLFSNILELCDWTLKGPDKKGCPIFHFIPRFILRQNDKQDGNEIHELLSMDKVLYHLIKSSSEFVIKPHHLSLPREKERSFVKAHYNNIVTKPNKKPAAFRIDDILFDKESKQPEEKGYPMIVHHGIRPIQMSYSGNPKYQELLKSYLKLRKNVANKPVNSRKDHDRLVEMKVRLEKMKMNSSLRRDVEVRMSSEGLKKTGINSDVCQHAMVLPVLVHHLRYHMCLKTLDEKLEYTFKDRTLMQLALTHPSYHLNFGMNPDQARNALANCGVKLPRYGDRKIHRMHTKKKGITNLISVMANLGKIEENQSMIRHNERLEFLGDAVLEFICSSHLYFMLPEASEGDLAMFRSALVQNSHLATLAKNFNLSDYMQFSHGPDLCKGEDLNHAMANCFEAIIGAIFLEGGLPAAADFFTKMAFKEEVLRNVWASKPRHPLQLQQPEGDRHVIPSSPVLQKLQEFEDCTGITFDHIRLLARAFTHPHVGFNNLTLGDNQRMEFLGDSVLQIIVSAYLYQHFPDHHEGHLTLLRSSLVNNRIQADIARQLGMDKYINFGKQDIKKVREKQLADVLEAFLAALFVDKGLKHVEIFCQVCFFPRVEDNIVNQEWIDSKSHLQQCCLALGSGKQPELPLYKVLQDSGPSHDKKFQVAVYYKGKRVGTGEGNSTHVAEMAAAKDALDSSYFPELARQKHFLDGKYQEKRTRNYEPAKPREKPSEIEKTVQEPLWVEH